MQQEGSLCAQHCLNNLLQGEYFTAVDLSSIAHQLDEEERMRMAEGGMGSEEYRTFLQVGHVGSDRLFNMFGADCLSSHPVTVSAATIRKHGRQRLFFNTGQFTVTCLQQLCGNSGTLLPVVQFLQVISNALRVWGLELILFNSREYQSLTINPM